LSHLFCSFWQSKCIKINKKKTLIKPLGDKAIQTRLKLHLQFTHAYTFLYKIKAKSAFFMMLARHNQILAVSQRSADEQYHQQHLPLLLPLQRFLCYHQGSDSPNSRLIIILWISVLSLSKIRKKLWKNNWLLGLKK
jgi:hypothetical protein